MKYMVMVNGRFMVSVEATSCLNAEHRILDEIYDGMQTALAFDQETMKTEHFVACMMSCETISWDELKQISEQYREGWEKYAEIRDTVKVARYEVEQLQRKLDAARDKLVEVSTAASEAEVEALKLKSRLDVRDDQ